MTTAATDQRMQALTQERYGPLQQMQWRPHPIPEPGPGRVLVRVDHAGIDPSIWHLMTGNPLVVRVVTGLRGPRQPIAGQDLSGTVVAVGPGGDQGRIGERVWGCASGALAEYVVAREHNVLPAPGVMEPAHAAALATSGITALQAIRAAHLTSESRVAVLGAGGGVGCFAVQIAADLGARVTGVCSAGKAQAVRSWGAAEVIDYAGRDLLHRPEQYDAIIDCAGNRGVRALQRKLTRRGALVIVGGELPGTPAFGLGRALRATVLSTFSKQSLTGLMATVRAEDLAELAALVEAGRLLIPVQRTFPMDRAVEALEYVRSGAAVGKVVVQVGQLGQVE